MLTTYNMRTRLCKPHLYAPAQSIAIAVHALARRVPRGCGFVNQGPQAATIAALLCLHVPQTQLPRCQAVNNCQRMQLCLSQHAMTLCVSGHTATTAAVVSASACTQELKLDEACVTIS